MIRHAVKLVAAKDTGDFRGDKSRRKVIAALVDRTQSLALALDLSVYPEADKAIAAVKSLNEVSEALDLWSSRLKSAPTTSRDAVEAQKNINSLRQNIDAMLGPVQTLVSTLELLLKSAVELEMAFVNLDNQSKEAQERLNQEKKRVTEIAKSITSMRGTIHV